MQPGKGYMIYHRNASELTFTYPTVGGSAGAPFAIGTYKSEKEITKHFNYTKTGLAHALFLKNLNVDIEAGDELGVFAGDRCVGGMKYMGHLNNPLIIWRALPDFELAGVEEGDRLTIHLWKSGETFEEVLEIDGDVEFKSERVLSMVRIRSDRTTGIVRLESETIPEEMELGQNYPNPFNPATFIDFNLNKASDVRLLIYNINGKLIRNLLSGTFLAGAYRVEWDGMNDKGLQVASGIYIYRMATASYSQTKKMIFTK
jgi:hypothetical protein